MKIQGLETLMYRILQRSEVKSADVMRSHGFRKFFISQCIKAGMDYNAREYLVGHKHRRGLDFNYDRTTEEDRLAEYVKAIPFLTIDQNQRLQTTVNELETVQAHKIAELQEQIDRNRKNTEHVMAMMDALKGVMTAKSQASFTAMKEALGWR